MYIKKYLKPVRHTYTSLGAALGVTRHTVANWETGRTKPTEHMIQRLTEELNVSKKELFEGEK